MNDTWSAVEDRSDLLTWSQLSKFRVQLGDRCRFSVPMAAGETKCSVSARPPPPLWLSPATADLAAGATQFFAAFLHGSQNNSGVTGSVVETAGGSIGPGGPHLAPVTPGADQLPVVGTGKQRLYVIPSLDLAIVRFGHGGGGAFTDHAFLGHVLGIP